MPCIFNIKKEDRCCQYCSAVCDERQPKPVETFTTNLQYFGEVSKEEKTKMDSTQEGPTTEIDFEQELYKAFGQVKDFTLGMRIAKWFYDMGKNSQEPVSEELEEACEQLAENARKHKAKTSSPFFSQTDYIQGVKDGAQWQKEKDESTTEDLGEYINELSKQFPEVSFAKLSRIAVRVAKWQREQIMKDAVEGYIERDKGGQLILGRTNLGAGDEFMLLDASTFHDIKCGDRRKAKIMIIIKED